MKLKEITEEMLNKMTQDTVIQKIKKTLGSENVSNIRKWKDEEYVKKYPSVSFVYNKKNYVATGYPKVVRTHRKYQIHDGDYEKTSSLTFNRELSQMFQKR